MPDKFRSVEDILTDPTLTAAAKFLMLLDQVPTCICGADCRTLQYLWSEVGRIRAKEKPEK
ncbi:MAG: hypothetical protein ABSC50_09415 [Candidatus Bathyarchaeia archaeon]